MDGMGDLGSKRGRASEVDAEVVSLLNADVLGRVHLHHISVRPAYRRKGVASVLLDSVRAAADEIDISLVTLQVWSFNEAAQAFFRRQGRHRGASADCVARPTPSNHHSIAQGRLDDHSKVDGTQPRCPVAELLALMGKGFRSIACKTFSMLDVGAPFVCSPNRCSLSSLKSHSRLAQWTSRCC
jgi:hypothetical protein